MTMKIYVTANTSVLNDIRKHLHEGCASLALAYVAQDLEPKAQSNAPVDWGTLKETPQIEILSRDAISLTFYGGSASGWGGEPRIYAAHQEYGTRFHGAQPFLTPAVDETFPGGIYKRKGDLIKYSFG